MTHPEDRDEALVDELRAFFGQVDPVPPLVTELANAAFGWRRLDADLAELLSDSSFEESARLTARQSGAPVRSVSFAAGAHTIDLEIHSAGPRRTLLGQLSPPSTATIDVQTAQAGEIAAARSDALGRFRVEIPAGGPIRLRVATGGPHPAIETSWFSI